MEKYRVVNDSLHIFDDGMAYTFDEILQFLVDKDYYYRYIAIPKKWDDSVVSDDELVDDIIRFLKKIGKLQSAIKTLKRKYQYIEFVSDGGERVIFFVSR